MRLMGHGPNVVSRSLAVVTVVLLILGPGGCAGEPELPDKPRVTVTVLPLAGLVDRIAPGLVDVTVMIPAGANPVSYEPVLSDLRAASESSVYLGVGHEAFTWEKTWVADLLDRSGARRVEASAGCPVEMEDPHVWLSTECTRSTARELAGQLTVLLPAYAERIDESLRSFLADIDSVENEAASRLEPHRGGAFVTLHPAWGYLARRHGIEQISILEHGSGDAGPGKLASIIERARSLGLRDVLVQPQFSSEPARLVAAELGGRVIELDPLARDWLPNMRRIVRAIADEATQ